MSVTSRSTGVSRLLVASAGVMAAIATVGLVVFLVGLGAILEDGDPLRFIFPFSVGFLALVLVALADRSSARAVRESTGHAISLEFIALGVALVASSYLVLWHGGQDVQRWLKIGGGIMMTLRVAILILLIASPAARRRAGSGRARSFRPIHLLAMSLNALAGALILTIAIVFPDVVSIAILLGWILSIAVALQQRHRRAWLGLVYPSLYLAFLAFSLWNIYQQGGLGR